MTWELNSAAYSPTFKTPDRNRWPIPFPALGKLYKIVEGGWSLDENKIIFVTGIVEEERGPCSLWIEYLEDEQVKRLRWFTPRIRWYVTADLVPVARIRRFSYEVRELDEGFKGTPQGILPPTLD